MRKLRSGIPSFAVIVAMATSTLYACSDEGTDEPTYIIVVERDTGMDSPDDDARTSDDNFASDADADGDGDADADGDADEVVGPICSEQNFQIDYKPVKLMIALDMSGSMVTPESKYFAARESIQTVIDDFDERFLFGFDSYPDTFTDESCTVDGPVWFDCEVGNETPIINWLETHMPVSGSGDPLLRELDKFLSSPSYAPNFTSDASGEDAYLLILADGDDCCGPSGTYNCAASWVDELAEKTRELSATGIKTVVVGYTRNADPDALDAVARNGGSPFSSYVPALDQAALTNALKTIAGTIASCDFDIAEPDPSSDPGKVNFYFDDNVVPFNDGCATGIGWTWGNDDHTTVHFCAQSCAQLNEGDVENISAKFGCPSVVMV